MLSRKPKKFSLNSSSTTLASIRKEGLSPVSQRQKPNKSAVDAATSILDELGVQRSSSVRSKTISSGEVGNKTKQKKTAPEKLESWDRKILKKQEIQKPQTKTLKNLEANKAGQQMFEKINSSDHKTTKRSTVNFGFHEKFVFMSMLVVIGVTGLAIVGGHLKLLDSAVFYQLIGDNLHQLEFEGEFEARLVENGYNRLPVFVVEGSIRNNFNESDQIKKIQLKAFAFDANQQLIANHFTYAGNVLSDEMLESMSPLDIKALRHSYKLGKSNSTELMTDRNQFLNRFSPQTPFIPFQVIFIKSVPIIKKTSFQIVSYVRNNKIVYVHAPSL